MFENIRGSVKPEQRQTGEPRRQARYYLGHSQARRGGRRVGVGTREEARVGVVGVVKLVST